MEKLRGRDEVVIEWGTYHPLEFWLISVKQAFVWIVGPCVFVYTAVVPWWRTQSVTYAWTAGNRCQEWRRWREGWWRKSVLEVEVWSLVLTGRRNSRGGDYEGGVHCFVVRGAKCYVGYSMGYDYTFSKGGWGKRGDLWAYIRVRTSWIRVWIRKEVNSPWEGSSTRACRDNSEFAID